MYEVQCTSYYCQITAIHVEKTEVVYKYMIDKNLDKTYNWAIFRHQLSVHVQKMTSCFLSSSPEAFLSRLL